MRSKNLLLRPWVLSTAAGMLVIAAVEIPTGTGATGTALGWLGALTAAITLPMATQLGMLAGALLLGLRIRHVVIGAMRRLGTWKLGPATITLRALPVTISAEIGPWRPPVILRSWLAGLLSACTGIGLVTTAWLLAGGPFGRGYALAATALMLHKLRPKRAPLSTSTGWLLFRLPRMPEPQRTEFRAGPIAAAANDALQEGDLDTAQRHVDQLTEQYPHLTATRSAQVAMLEARGEYVRATLHLLDYLSSGPDLPPREMSYLLAGLAGLGFAAAETGQLPAETILPTAKKALTDAIQLGYPEFELSGTRGMLALLEGDLDEAVRLAAIGAEHSPSPLSRADDYATLAQAHMARRDNAAARRALAAAEELAAWWPRVARVRQRLHVS